MGIHRSLITFILSGISILQISLVAKSAEPTTPPPKPVVAEFPIGRWGELITIPVTWGGKPACFILDTGCTFSVVDGAYFPGLPPLPGGVEIGTAGGTREMRKVVPPDLQVGPVSLRRSGAVLVHDLSAFRVSAGRPIIGVLGMTGIKDFTVQMDFDDHKLKFLHPDDDRHPEWGKEFALKLDESNNPYVRIRIAGEDEDLAIDTGSNEFVGLLPRTFDRLHEATKQPVISLPSLTANGTVEFREMRVAAFEAAGMKFQNVDFSETKTTSACGLDFLERHLVTLDFPGHRLYLKPGKEFDHVKRKNMAGLRPVRSGKDLVARFVVDGGPAYEAGIRDGDILLELNGKPIDTYGMLDVRERLTSGEGKEVAIKFRRGDAERTVKVKLRRAD
jgi:hypothetical protein